MDLAIVLILACSLATLACTHLALSWALFMRSPRWRGLVVLVVPPLAPYFGFVAGLRARSVLWLLALTLYLLSWLAASF